MNSKKIRMTTKLTIERTINIEPEYYLLKDETLDNLTIEKIIEREKFWSIYSIEDFMQFSDNLSIKSDVKIKGEQNNDNNSKLSCID